jgi:hypothetical protein
MRCQSTGHVIGPADIGQVAAAREGADDIDVAVHVSCALALSSDYRKLPKEPTGMTG